MKHPLSVSRMATPLGDIVLGFTARGLAVLEFADRLTQRQLAHFTPQEGGEDARHAALQQQLQDYFQGKRRLFEIALDLCGTDFQQRVWQSLLDIPYGTTWSYGQQARHLGQAQAVRAVAAANGRNPVSIVVPCHRVIGQDGRLTGYGGGLARKAFLLRLEGAVFV